MKARRFSWKKRMRSFSYAFKGIGYLLETQHNSWIECGVGLIAVALGFYFHIRKVEWLFIIFSIALVFMAELMNTAIETLVDLISPEMNEKAGRIKDLAAGAVLFSAIFAFITGIIIFLPRLLSVLSYP